MIMSTISFKAIVSGKQIFNDPIGEKCIKIDLIEEREIPPPILIAQGQQSELMKEISPILQQVLRSMPITKQNKIVIPRLTIWLTMDEWELLHPKPEIGDEIDVIVSHKSINIKK